MNTASDDAQRSICALPLEQQPNSPVDDLDRENQRTQ